ncbi:MAG: permease [Atribacterota bacterium]|nr:permease [Atribacterota bacterium]MDD3641582.1 permease [Atribacterota bacterium]MDD4289489.1 permease [Atribacterota bacterium]MDD4764846.1 permease [Atribacterota bacterium]
MNTLINTIQYFIMITLELTILFLGISALVALLLMYLPKEKIKIWMNGKGIIGNIFGAIIGSVTPFCACSTIPLTLGFLEAGIPFGAVMSFVISSPLLNPIIIGMLIVLMGIKTAILYFLIVFMAAIIFGIILEKTGGSKLIKKVRLKGEGHLNDEVPESLKNKLKLSFLKAWSDFRGVLLYLLIGVGIGAIIYGYLPQEFVLKYAGPDNLFAVPIAALIGVPLYIRAESAIPIGISLMQKGMNIGTVIALVIGGAGMAIPEMSMLAAIFKKNLVTAIVLVIFLTAVTGGYIFNAI